MQNFVDYLERMIDGCDSLGGMEREKAIYQSVLKAYRLRYNVAGVSDCRISEPVKCKNCDEMVVMVSQGEFCPSCYC